MNAITLIAIRMYVAGARPRWMPGVIRVTLVRSRAHSGQRIPTGVTVCRDQRVPNCVPVIMDVRYDAFDAHWTRIASGSPAIEVRWKTATEVGTKPQDHPCP